MVDDAHSLTILEQQKKKKTQTIIIQYTYIQTHSIGSFQRKKKKNYYRVINSISKRNAYKN